MMRFLPDVFLPCARCLRIVREPRLQSCGAQATHYLIGPPYNNLAFGSIFCEEHAKQIITTFEQNIGETWGFARIDPEQSRLQPTIDCVEVGNWKPRDGQV